MAADLIVVLPTDSIEPYQLLWQRKQALKNPTFEGDISITLIGSVQRLLHLRQMQVPSQSSNDLLMPRSFAFFAISGLLRPSPSHTRI